MRAVQDMLFAQQVRRMARLRSLAKWIDVAAISLCVEYQPDKGCGYVCDPRRQLAHTVSNARTLGVGAFRVPWYQVGDCPEKPLRCPVVSTEPHSGQWG